MAPELPPIELEEMSSAELKSSQVLNYVYFKLAIIEDRAIPLSRKSVYHKRPLNWIGVN